VAAVIVSAVGYFFSLIAVLTTIMAFMTLLIGGLNPLTFEKVHHYPHPRPVIEQTIIPTNPEPHDVGLALGTNETTPAKDLLAQDQRPKGSRPAAQTNAENRKPERKIKPERLAHLHQPKVLARQRQNYEGYGYGMALGYAEGYHSGLELDGQR
jgi:hypothetical protein